MQWLQFNDFHIGGQRAPDIEVLKSLVEKVSQVVGKGSGKIDAVFLVGDISYSGKSEEYQAFAEHFLLPLKAIPAVADAQIFVVPGNHDVKCDESTPITWETIGIRNQRNYFAEDLVGKKARNSRVPTFAPYIRFITEHSLIGPNPEIEVSKLIENVALPFDILATNTAFFSDFEQNSSLPSTPFPLMSIRHHVKSGARERPLLIVGHHSLSSLKEIDKTQLETFLAEKRAIYIHGHAHKPSVTFDCDGAIQSIGFGASYVTPLPNVTDTGYRNSFALCSFDTLLRVEAFAWEPDPGKWIESTERDFSQLKELPKGSGQQGRYARIPLAPDGGRRELEAKAISSLPRTRARSVSIIPTETNDTLGIQLLFELSKTINELYRRDKPKIGKPNPVDGKLEIILDHKGGRALLICIPGVNHVLSFKEIEGFNTKLDSEDFTSVTVLSLGKISEDAHKLYVRLKKKSIEVLTNKDLTQEIERILSPQQVRSLEDLDSARHTVYVLIGDEALYLLVVVRETSGESFHVIDHNGDLLSPSAELVLRLRIGSPEFATMQYTGELSLEKEEFQTHFDEHAYLSTCYDTYNVVRYAALAHAGIRLENLPLSELYVSATAAEVSSANTRLEAVVGDHLASFPLSDSLRSELERQLLLSVERQAAAYETSDAREFCQRYGAVLIVGDPGAGKTCFVKNAILSYCSRAKPEKEQTASDWYGSHIPVMVQLSEVVREKDLESGKLVEIASRLLARRGLSLPLKELDNLSKQGRVAWFFDGLDEVVSIEKRATAVQRINELVEQTLALGNRIIVTSRPAAVRVVNLLPALRNLQIQGFSESQMETLAQRVLSTKVIDTPTGAILDQTARAQNHQTIIKQLLDDCKSKPGVARLAQNPLLLTLLIIIYANSGAPSAKRHVIYGQAIDTLASVRGRETGHQPISPQDLRERLGAVALSVYKKESGLLPSRKEVCSVVHGVMERQLKRPVTLVEASDFVQKVAESTGLIAVESQPGESDEASIVTFMHHSFLEYYAAVALSLDLENVDIAILVNQPRWHEVLTLLAGIIGENADIAPILTKILSSPSDVSHIDAKLLLFALDCTLECDVPSEASQQILGHAIASCLSDGPGRVDPWVRAELGQRLGNLLLSCGGGHFEDSLCRGVAAPDPETCSASIAVATIACSGGFESEKIVKAVEGACTRTEDIVLAAICETAGDDKQFRTEPILQTIERSLTRSGIRKRAAFAALRNIPQLAVKHWGEIINGIEDKDEKVSQYASIAAIQAGLNAELVTLSAPKKDVLVRALQNFDAVGDRSEHRLPKIKKETLEYMLSSPQLREKLIAIQLIPSADASENYVHDKLISLLPTKDHQEAVAVLSALRSKEALSVFLQGDLKKVVSIMREGTFDVRLASLRLLACFGGESFVLESLLSLDCTKMNSEEHRLFFLALGNARILKERVATLLQGELDYFTHDERKTDAENSRKLVSVLMALRRLSESCPEIYVQRVFSMIGDYKRDMSVRKAAVLCYPAIAVPSAKTVEAITSLLQKPPVGMDEVIVQMPGILAERCKTSIDYVIACVGSLKALRDALVQLHQKYLKRPVSADIEAYITEIRQGIEDLTQIMVTFSEFIDSTATGAKPPDADADVVSKE